jgi:hypothetical protein
VQPTKKRFFLVACVSKKRAEPCPARELYCSAWFRAARRYVEATKNPWFILSARHGLVRPDARIAPYEASLTDFIAPQRWQWTENVVADIMLAVRAGDRVDILAGERYREFLVPALSARRINVAVPLRASASGSSSVGSKGHAEISKQLRWLDAHQNAK